MYKVFEKDQRKLEPSMGTTHKERETRTFHGHYPQREIQVVQPRNHWAKSEKVRVLLTHIPEVQREQNLLLLKRRRCSLMEGRKTLIYVGLILCLLLFCVDNILITQYKINKSLTCGSNLV